MNVRLADGKLTERGSATQAEVAARAGVSGATVSYVLNGRRDRSRPVTLETRERVMSAVSELGYHPNRAGRILRRGRTELIALVLPPPISPWVEEMSRQLEAVAESYAYNVVHLMVHGPDRLTRITDLLTGGLVDGAVITGIKLSAAQRTRLINSQLAMAFVNETLQPKGFDVLRQHARQGMRNATTYLAGQGRRRIAYVGNLAQERTRGYFDGMKASGLMPDPELTMTAGESRDEMLRSALILLDRPRRQRPDAVLAATDRTAIATLWAAQALGISVPDDLAVMGAGNTPEGMAVRPALTSVGPAELDFHPLAERLFDRIGDPTLPGLRLDARWEVVRRDSA